MYSRVAIPGAGFGGLELTTTLSETLTGSQQRSMDKMRKDKVEFGTKRKGRWFGR